LPFPPDLLPPRVFGLLTHAQPAQALTNWAHYAATSAFTQPILLLLLLAYRPLQQITNPVDPYWRSSVSVVSSAQRYGVWQINSSVVRVVVA